MPNMIIICFLIFGIFLHDDIIHFAYGNNVSLFVVNVDKTATYEFQLNHNIDLFKL